MAEDVVVWTMEDYNALCKAIGQGVLETKYGDKEIKFRSLKEMIQIKRMMETNLGIKKPGRVFTYASQTKGLI